MLETKARRSSQNFVRHSKDRSNHESEYYRKYWFLHFVQGRPLMAFSKASIDHHEQLGTTSCPPSFNNRAEETLYVSRRHVLTAVFRRVFHATVVCASCFSCLLLTGLLEHIAIFALLCKETSRHDKQTRILTVTSEWVQP